jgi:outer membrane immunogenic protein
MKKLVLTGIALTALLAGSAAAADLAVEAPAYRIPPRPLWSWSGLYMGINGGYSMGKADVTQTVAIVPGTTSASFTNTIAPAGGLLGGQVGFNWQTGPVVWGIEADFQGASQSDTTAPPLTALATTAYEKIKWFGTARGRVGWANDGLMLYVTAGGAWARIDEADTVIIAPPGTAGANTFSNTRSGFVGGAGIEIRLWWAWTAKVEYLHMDLGGMTNAGLIPPPIGPFTVATTTGRIRDNIVRVGLNWQFGGAGQRWFGN